MSQSQSYTLMLVLLAICLVGAYVPAISASSPPCKRLIDKSTNRNFDWNSDAALELAQCLQSQRLPTPPFSSCIFYTASSKEQAVAYGSATNRTTIYDVYDPKVFDRSIWPAKVWEANGHLRNLFRITSKAYAMSCSGEAHLVLPGNVKDEEVCRESIWVTDEYEAIRAGDSGIVLPIWRVSWREIEKGVWGWIKQQLRAVGLRQETKRSSLRFTNGQDVVEPDQDLTAHIGQKLLAIKEQWSWDGLDNGMMEDLWAVKSGMCGR